MAVDRTTRAGQQAEVKLAQTTRERVRIQPARGRPRTRPQHLVPDRGYHSRSFRRYLRGRGPGHTIPSIRGANRRRPARPLQADPIRCASRWIIERTKAWLQNFRPVLVRHDRLLITYPAFAVLACVTITLAALLR